MKSSKIFLIILIISILISCSNEDENIYRNEVENTEQEQQQEQEEEEEEEIISPCEKLFKKQTLYEGGVWTYVNEVFYDSISRIDSIYQFDITTNVSQHYKVSYEQNVISKIKYEKIYNFDPSFNWAIVYDDVEITTSTVMLNSSNSERKIEINYTDIYVDKTKEYFSQNPPAFNENTFSRNEQNQIISNTAYGGTNSYSNHVNGENNDVVGIGVRYELSNILLILKLRTSSSTPLTLGLRDLNIEYENNSCIIKEIVTEDKYSAYEYINP